MTKHVFPQPEAPVKMNDPTGGLTKRELFAAMAMQGILASADFSRLVTASGIKVDQSHSGVVMLACQLSDALLTELLEKT